MPQPTHNKISPKREHLYKLHRNLCRDALLLMSKKNIDYAKDSDPFENFRAFGRFGILVRLSDKLARLQNCTRNGKCEVKDETLRDTVMDIINYAILFEGYE